MTKSPSVPYISFKVKGGKKVFTMPPSGKDVPWDEIEALILEELIHQFSRGDIVFYVYQVGSEGKRETVLIDVLLRKATLAKHIKDEKHLEGEAATEYRQKYIERYAKRAVQGIRAHFYPPSVFEQFEAILRDIRLGRGGGLN